MSTGPAFVGLNVPETSGPASGRLVAAASSRVKVTLLVGDDPPTSERMIAFCPPGPTSMMSTSSGNAWLKLLRVTVTLLMTSVDPLTIVNGDGYGVAAPPEFIVIEVGLHPLVHSPVIVTVKLQAPPAFPAQLTVVVPIGKNDPDAGVQLIGPQVPVNVGEE